MEIIRSALRYPGGKFRIAKWIHSFDPPYKFYVEPYFGGGGAFFQKPRAGAEIINDINEDVVNVFRVLRDREQAAELERLCRLTPFSYREYVDAYEPCDDPIERARRTVFRATATIGTDGVTRARSGFRALKNFESGLTTASEWSRYHDQIKFFTERLQGVVIECRPALRVIEAYDTPETHFYLDPPYLMDTRERAGRGLYAYEMGDEASHRELAEALHRIQGTAIISGYDSPLYNELYEDWKKEVKSARAMGNSPRVECIWLSPNIQPKLF